jgi:hypothetical protein
MWTLRISSGTNQFPTPKSVIQAILAGLIEHGAEDSWAHFELAAEGGWFKNLLGGEKPWIEVAYVNRNALQLNLGKSKLTTGPAVPAKWPETETALFTVPVGDLEELISWLETRLSAYSGGAPRNIAGWIEP